MADEYDSYLVTFSNGEEETMPFNRHDVRGSEFVARELAGKEEKANAELMGREPRGIKSAKFKASR